MTVGRLARAAAIVAILGMVSRLLGYFREAVLAGAYGTSAQADAFVNALLIVNAFAAILLYALVTLVIPVFQSEREDVGEDSAWRLISALAGWVGVGLVVVASVCAIWPEGPAALFRLDPERAAICARLIRIMAPALALQGFSALFTAMLQIHGRFAGPAAVGIAFNLGIIGAIAIFHRSIGIEAAAWGVVVGATAQVVLQLPQFARLLRTARARPAFLHPRLGMVALLALPVLGASALQQVNSFTDKLFASSLESGRVAALNYASALGQAPRAALLLPLMTPLFPLIARLMAERREREALVTFERVAGLLALVAIPLGLLMSLYSTEVTQLAFQRGKCGAQCVSETSGPLLYYALALWPAFLSLLLNRTLSAANHQRGILWTTLATVAITIGLDLLLLGPMEQSGLALASTIGVYLNAAMLIALLRHHFPSLSLSDLGRRQGRVLAAGLIGAAVALLADLILPSDDVSSLEALVRVAAKTILAVAAFLLASRVLAPVELAEAGRSMRALVLRRGRPPVS
jgi:putative peptidoglycan lipid II flippase